MLPLFITVVYGPNGTWTSTVNASTGVATINLWNNSIGTQPTAAQLTIALATAQLQAAQAVQVAAIETSFAGVAYSNVSYMGTSFPCTTSDLLLLSCTLVQAGTPQGLPSGFAWYDINGKGTAMTLAELQGLGNLFFSQVYGSYGVMEGLIANIMSATTVSAVQSVVW